MRMLCVQPTKAHEDLVMDNIEPLDPVMAKVDQAIARCLPLYSFRDKKKKQD